MAITQVVMAQQLIHFMVTNILLLNSDIILLLNVVRWTFCHVNSLRYSIETSP